MHFNIDENNEAKDLETIKCFVTKFHYEYGIFLLFDTNKVLYKIINNNSESFDD
jgi:hypothetical protein